MSRSNTGQAQVAETLTQETKTFIRQVRTRTHRKYAPEDKIRIVLEGYRLEEFRREVSVSGLCRREGIKPGVFYAWTKEFMEALVSASPLVEQFGLGPGGEHPLPRCVDGLGDL